MYLLWFSSAVLLCCDDFALWSRLVTTTSATKRDVAKSRRGETKVQSAQFGTSSAELIVQHPKPKGKNKSKPQRRIYRVRLMAGKKAYLLVLTMKASSKRPRTD